MKTLCLLIVLSLNSVFLQLYSQTYDPSDSLTLLAIDAKCDASDSLNWNTEVDPGNWTGVTWDGSTPKRVLSLSIDSYSLTDTMDVSPLTNLQYLLCFENKLTSLNLSGLTSLAVLNCGSNLLNALDLHGLTNLSIIGCYNNNLTDLDISGLTNLIYLNCGGNQISGLDLTGHTNLMVLHCYGNLLTTLDATTLVSLDTLNCISNQLTSLKVSGLTNLKYLGCLNNQLTNLDVTGLTNLSYLACSFNKLSSLNLSGLSNLSVAYCIGNKLPFSSLSTGLSADSIFYIPQDTIFQSHTYNSNTIIDYSSEALIDDSVTTFYFYKDTMQADSNSTGKYTTTGVGKYNCHMTNNKFPGLTLVTAITTIEPQIIPTYSPVDSMALLAIDAACDSLNTLNWNTEPNPGNWTGVSWNDSIPKRVLSINVTSKSLNDTLDVTSLTYLDTLICYSNHFKGLKVSGLTNLKFLEVSNNQLFELDLSFLTNLTNVQCYNNRLTSIDLTGSVNLTDLICINNKLVSLNLTGLSKLIRLGCYLNHLTSLDVSSNPNLFLLDVRSNNLSVLDLSDLTNLVILLCSQNQLTALNMSALTKLSDIDCYSNKLTFSSLATGLGVTNYTYSPQDTIFEPQSFPGNTIIDYSSEALIDGTYTNFVFYKDGAIAGSNTTGIFATTGNGKYCCHMTNDKFPGLTLITALVTISEVPPERIEDIQNSELSFYPNPATDRINFTAPEKITGASLYSVSGQELIKTGNVTNGIDVSWLAKGIYFLQINQNGSTQTQKVVIK